jgi:hypothetical protein
MYAARLTLCQPELNVRRPVAIERYLSWILVSCRDYVTVVVSTQGRNRAICRSEASAYHLSRYITPVVD